MSEKLLWWVIDQQSDGEFRARPDSENVPRPADAKPDGGDPWRPWYQDVEHTHSVAKEGVEGAHVQAYDEIDAVCRTRYLLLCRVNGEQPISYCDVQWIPHYLRLDSHGKPIPGEPVCLDE